MSCFDAYLARRRLYGLRCEISLSAQQYDAETHEEIEEPFVEAENGERLVVDTQVITARQQRNFLPLDERGCDPPTPRILRTPGSRRGSGARVDHPAAPPSSFPGMRAIYRDDMVSAGRVDEIISQFTKGKRGAAPKRPERAPAPAPADSDSSVEVLGDRRGSASSFFSDAALAAQLQAEEALAGRAPADAADVCVVCAGPTVAPDGSPLADVVLCDGDARHECHLACAGLDAVPDGDWRCRRCEPPAKPGRAAKGPRAAPAAPETPKPNRALAALRDTLTPGSKDAAPSTVGAGGRGAARRRAATPDAPNAPATKKTPAASKKRRAASEASDGAAPQKKRRKKAKAGDAPAEAAPAAPVDDGHPGGVSVDTVAVTARGVPLAAAGAEDELASLDEAAAAADRAAAPAAAPVDDGATEDGDVAMPFAPPAAPPVAPAAAKSPARGRRRSESGGGAPPRPRKNDDAGAPDTDDRVRITEAHTSLAGEYGIVVERNKAWIKVQLDNDPTIVSLRKSQIEVVSGGEGVPAAEEPGAAMDGDDDVDEDMQTSNGMPVPALGRDAAPPPLPEEPEELDGGSNTASSQSSVDTASAVWPPAPGAVGWPMAEGLEVGQRLWAYFFPKHGQVLWGGTIVQVLDVPAAYNVMFDDASKQVVLAAECFADIPRDDFEDLPRKVPNAKAKGKLKKLGLPVD